MALSYEEGIRRYDNSLTKIKESLDILEDTKLFSFNAQESVANLHRDN